MAGSAGKRDFCMVDMQLLRRMEEAGASGRDTRVLVAYLRHQEQGMPLGAWTFREKTYFTSAKTVAANLGITEKAVSRSLSHLVRLGIIERISAGHKGNTALYALKQSPTDTSPFADPHSSTNQSCNDPEDAKGNVENSDSSTNRLCNDPQSSTNRLCNTASKVNQSVAPLRVSTSRASSREAEGEGLPSDEEEASHDQTAAEWLDEATERQGSRP